MISFKYGYIDEPVPDGWKATPMMGWHGLRKRVLLERVDNDKRKSEGTEFREGCAAFDYRPSRF